MIQLIPNGAQTGIDVGMVGILAGVLTNILPPLVSIVTLVWFSIKIYETATVQKLLGKTKDDA